MIRNHSISPESLKPRLLEKAGSILLAIGLVATLSACETGEGEPFVPEMVEEVRFYSGEGQTITAEKKAQQIVKAYQPMGININADQLETAIHDTLKDEAGLIHGGDHLWVGFNSKEDRLEIYTAEDDIPDTAYRLDLAEDWNGDN